MKLPFAIRTQVRGFGHCAVTGILVVLLATPTFAQSAPATTSLSAATTLETTSSAPDSLPLISTDTTTPDVNALPEAPAATEISSSAAPATLDLLAEPDGQNNAVSSSSTTPKKHKMRPGMLALGIVGAAAAGFGAYIFSIKTTATGEKDALGTIFLAPGAAAAGLGFYFAFK
jgi:hypothetical protein